MHTAAETNDLDRVSKMLVVSSNCLDDNIPKMYDLISEILNETKWDDSTHLKTVIAGTCTELMNSVAQSGHSYAMRAASSHLSLSQYYGELYSGISQVKFMGSLHSSIENMLPEITRALKEISNLLKNSKLRFSVNTESDMEIIHQNQMERFSKSLNCESPSDFKAPSNFLLTEKPIQTFYCTPFSVYYTGKSFRCVPYNHRDGPALQTLSHLMTNKYLHMELREKGGAYGGRAMYNPLCGTLQMMSYRDPKVFRTLKTYNNVVDWSKKIAQTLTVSDLNEAKLNIFQVRFYSLIIRNLMPLLTPLLKELTNFIAI